MKLLSAFLCLIGFCATVGPVQAESPPAVTVTVDMTAAGQPIPENFTGLSFGMKALLPGKGGAHLFSPTNTAFVKLFQNIGLRHLRVGGTTVESPPAMPIPGRAEIDELFAFARAAGINKIIYSLRLLETNAACNYAATNAELAGYIWSHYRSALDCFAIGNEPDVRRVFKQDITITNFQTYLKKWRQFAAAITNAVPEAKFAGPDAGSANIDWTTNFAESEKESGLVAVVSEHYYNGGKGAGVPAEKAVDDMLSPAWLKSDERLYRRMAKPILSAGLSYRFTEANDHYSGGVAEASDTFAGALWALDFLHWWAAHGAGGVDFHNTQWVVSDVVHPGADGLMTINPKAYGIKAFDLGSHGAAMPVTLDNADGINLTAYAVRGNGNLFVTIINKEHGDGARAAEVTIDANGAGKKPEVVFLTSPHGDIAAKTGIDLGGEQISNSKAGKEKWSRVKSGKAGECVVKVAPSSAAIVKMAAP